MNINEVSRTQAVQQQKQSREQVHTAAQQVEKDKAEVSAEAQALYDAQRLQRLEEIDRKIQSGDYFSNGVTEQVAVSMLKDIINPTDQG